MKTSELKKDLNQEPKVLTVTIEVMQVNGTAKKTILKGHKAAAFLAAQKALVVHGD